jgi:hypothetical protein
MMNVCSSCSMSWLTIRIRCYKECWSLSDREEHTQGVIRARCSLRMFWETDIWVFGSFYQRKPCCLVLWRPVLALYLNHQSPNSALQCKLHLWIVKNRFLECNVEFVDVISWCMCLKCNIFKDKKMLGSNKLFWVDWLGWLMLYCGALTFVRVQLWMKWKILETLCCWLLMSKSLNIEISLYNMDVRFGMGPFQNVLRNYLGMPSYSSLFKDRRWLTFARGT